MRIICKSVDEFISNVTGGTLFANTCWVSKTINPIDDNSKNAVKFLVLFQVSVIKVFKEDGGECMVELGIDCGYDYHDATQDYQGSELADEHREKLKAFCEEQGFIVKPGILDM